MNLIFKKIILNNFFSFSHAELDLNEMGYTLVEGRNYCKLDNAYSNGSGKSSIFNGICFALTGETAQGVSNGVENIFANPEDCWVELHFKADNDNFIIKRFKTPRVDLKISINGEDKSGKGVRESSKLLATYLPDLSSTLINSIIILGQGLPNRFTNNNPAQRKEILEKLTRSDFMIQSIKDKLDSRQSELKIDLRNKEDKLLSTNSQIDVYKLQLKNYNDDLMTYASIDSSEKSLDERIATLDNQISEITGLIKTTGINIDNLNSNIDKINSQYNEVLVSSPAKLTTLTVEIDSKIADKKKSITDLNTDIKLLTNEIKKLDNITDVCPTCGQKIPNVNKPDTTAQKAELKSLKEGVSLLNDELNSLTSEKTVIVEEYNKEQSAIRVNLMSQITAAKSELKNSIHTKEVLLKDQAVFNEQAIKLRNLKANYSKLVSDIKATETIIDELTVEANKLEDITRNISDHLLVIQQMITLAKREFRGILLLNVIQYINRKVKSYSQNVFGTEELEFSLDENEIDITYCGKPYENLSGGERQKIDVIVQLALRDVLSNQLNIHSNLLVVDECFDNLDLQGCSKIMNLISSLNDIDSVFIVSHHAQDLELTKDNSIVVEKSEDGVSSIKIV